MADAHEVVIDIDGLAIDVTDEYTIKLSMLEHGSPFTFSLWSSREANAAWDRVLDKALCESPVTVRIDGALQMAGVVEAVNGDATKSAGATLVVSGTDIAGVAMRWDCDPQVTIVNSTLQDALKALFAPLGIKVVIMDARAATATSAGKRRAPGTAAQSHHRGASDNQSIPDIFKELFVESFHEAVRAGEQATDAMFGFLNNVASGRGVLPHTTLAPSRAVHRESRPRKQAVDCFRPQIGEKVWTAAERLCKRLGYLMWAAPWDSSTIAIIVDKPRYDSTALYQFTRRIVDGRTTQDSNILSGGPRISTAEVPSEVNLYGHGGRGDKESTRVSARIENDRWDADFVRTPVRRKPIHARSETGRGVRPVEQQASRLLDAAMARHSTYGCRVQGHDQAYQGDASLRLLYAINTVARVRDDVFRVDRSYLIDTVEFSRARGAGTTTQLTMHSLNAIKCEPEPDAT